MIMAGTAAGRRGSASTGKKATAARAGGRSAAPAGGTKSAAGSSKPGMNKRKNTAKRKVSVQENPLARRNSAVYDYGMEAARMDVPSRRAPQAAPRRARDARARGYGREYRPAPRRRRKRRGGFSFAALLLALMICGLAGLGVWRAKEYRAFAEMKQVVARQTFYAGTQVDGIDVSQMTLEQALEYWNSQIEPQYRDRAAVLNDGTRVTAAELGYQSDYAQTLSSAWSAGRNGSLEERYLRMMQGSGQAAAYSVNRTPCEASLVEAFAAAIAQQVDQEPQDAKLVSFNTQTYNFEFEPEVLGRRLNQAQLVADIEAVLAAGGGEVQMQIDVLQPEITQENVAANYGMISYAVTDASSSNSNRLENIRLALSMIDGISLEPGESFSFNQVVGERTTARGFKTAKAYSQSKVVDEVGGGICQVSTTLFNAAVKADLQIDERHPHSLTVSYVDLGKDAAVDWGNKDLRFTNTSEDRIYIGCYLTEDKRVRIGVFGRLIPDGVTITLESEKTDTIEYSTEYQVSFSLASGQQRVAQKGKNGYRAVTYKVWWDASGNELRRTELCKSRYSPTAEIIEYGA